MRRTGRILVLLAACLMVAAALAGCMAEKKEEAPLATAKKIRIVCTNFAGYDFARHIVKEHGEVTMLMKAGMDVHSFSPSPKELKAVADCDLFIYTGGDSDEWVDRVLDATGKEPASVCRMMDAVELSREEYTEGMRKEKGKEMDEEEMDEHVWTSPVNAIAIVKKINESVSAWDPAHAEDYRKNTGFGSALP